MPPSVPAPSTDSKNSFFGIKISASGYNVNDVTDAHLLIKDDFSNSIKTWYGTTGAIAMQEGKLSDGSFGLSFPTTDGGTLVVGALSDGNYGMRYQDSTGYTLFEMTGSTWYWYDKSTGKNVMQVGKLPDGSYGWAVAKSGKNVLDGF